MKFESKNYFPDKESVRRGKLAMGFVGIVFATSEFWWILQYGKHYCSSSRWVGLLSYLFGPFGPSAFLFFISLTLIIPSLRKQSDRTKGK